MKRKLSLLLAVVMILGSFSFAFAAEETAAEKAGAFLKEVGVLEGINGDLKLEDNLRRQDMVFMIARLHGAEEEAKAYSPEGLKFTDFTDPNYRTIIKWAVDKGLIVGHTEERFGFNEDVIAQQYATVLLRALGYNDKVATDEGYAKALEEAKALGILEGLEVENATEITRGQMAEMTFNALGAKMKDSDKTLAEFLDIKMPEEPKATELKVEKVYTENLAEIRVKLSNAELVKTKDALYNPANYRLTNTNAKVRHVHLEEDELVLTLVPYGKVMDQPKFEVLTKGDVFKLTIRNIDPKINSTSGWTEAVDNGIPVVENVDFMGDYGIKVTTSEPIANPEERNFRLDSRTSMFVEQYGRDIILTPYHKGTFDKAATELTIDLLNDFAGYKTVKTIEKMELSTDESLPKVEKAYRSGNKLVVEFDRDVYHKSVAAYESRRDLGNVSFVERRAPFYAKDAVKVDVNVVEYTFEREIPKGIEITVQDVANHFNKAMEKEVIVPDEYKDDFAPVVISTNHNPVIGDTFEKTLKGYSDEKLKLELDKGFEADTKEITVIFDKDIAQIADKKITNANVKDYFNLYELDITKRGETAAKDIKINVAYVKDSNDRIKLSYEGIKVNNKDRDFDYILEVKDLHDLSGNRMSREYLDFQVLRQGYNFDIDNIDIKESRYFNRDGIEIVLEFNDYVNKVEASNEENYYLDGKLHVDEAIVERDGKTVSLVVYDYATVASFLKDYGVLEISPRVKDISRVPAKSVEHRFWDLKTKKFIEDKNVASDGAITYIINDKKATKDELDYDVVTGPQDVEVGLNVKGYDEKTLEIRVFKDGALNKTVIDTLTDDYDLPLASIIKLDQTVRGKYELVARVLDGSKVVEEGTIKINIVSPDTDLTAKFGVTNLKEEVNVLPYGTKIEDLKFKKSETDTLADADADIVIALDTPANKATFTAEIVNDTLTVKVTAENGDVKTYRFMLDVQKIVKDNSTLTATASGTTVTLELKDQQGTPVVITGLTADKFVASVEKGATGTATTITPVAGTGFETPAGTYKFTADANLAAGDVVTITVGGVTFTVTVA